MKHLHDGSHAMLSKYERIVTWNIPKEYYSTPALGGGGEGGGIMELRDDETGTAP